MFLFLDKQYILKKCPYLLNEMLCVAQQLYMLAQSERGVSEFYIVNLQILIREEELFLKQALPHETAMRGCRVVDMGG